MGAVSEATRENFDELVESGTTLVDVWGPDCRPELCRYRAAGFRMLLYRGADISQMFPRPALFNSQIQTLFGDTNKR